MSSDVLNEEDKKELLRIARKAIEGFLAKKGLPRCESQSAALKEPAGAFVTLEKGGALRGCIGHLVADKPLDQTVQEMAVQAATGDPRFSPVTLSDLPTLAIEISVLSPLKRVVDVSEIRVGLHGLLVALGMRRGVLLPQVAVRERWDRETFLGMTCLKAGLPFDAWRGGQMEISVFSAEVFGETDL